jgi:hypothetical protein
MVCPAPRRLSQAAMRSRPRLKLVLFAAFVLVIYLLWFTRLAPTELFPEAQFDETSFGQRGVWAQKLHHLSQMAHVSRDRDR